MMLGLSSRSSIAALLIGISATPGQAQSAWHEIETAVSPPATYAQGMVYDSVRGLTVLTRQTLSPSGHPFETYEYDGVNWQLRDLPLSPSGASWAVAFDSLRGVVVQQGPQNETWEYDGSTWALVSPGGPIGTIAIMSFDPVAGVIVVLSLPNTWELETATGTWTQVGPAPPVTFPPENGNLVFDEGTGKTLYVGGEWSGFLTYEYDQPTHTWTQLFPTTSPSPRIRFDVAYDSVRGRVVLHGGVPAIGSASHADTWSYDASVNTWVEETTAAGPTRARARMVYDKSRSVLVSFGGTDNTYGSYFDTTYELASPLPATNYCSSLPNSSGVSCHLSLIGSASLTRNHLELMATGVVPDQPGLYLYGGAQTQMPFGDGTRCVAFPLYRMFPFVHADGQGKASLDVSPAGVVPGGGITSLTPGAQWNFQLWYRDPHAPGGAGFNLSDGLSVTFTP